MGPNAVQPLGVLLIDAFCQYNFYLYELLVWPRRTRMVSQHAARRRWLIRLYVIADLRLCADVKLSFLNSCFHVGCSTRLREQETVLEQTRSTRNIMVVTVIISTYPYVVCSLYCVRITTLTITSLPLRETNWKSASRLMYGLTCCGL